ncbi:MAG: chorismate-binding protein [Actinomycetota bacterium]|nr:chorismate-binding protein [Actinomycetota bacterium]
MKDPSPALTSSGDDFLHRLDAARRGGAAKVTGLKLEVFHPLQTETVGRAVRAGMWFSGGGHTVVGTGERTTLEVASGEAGTTIRQLVADGAPGVLFTAGFDPQTPTTLIVPDGLVVDAGALPVEPPGVPYEATALEVTISESARAWSASVAEAAAAIAEATNPLRKVVLARELRVRADTVIDPQTVMFGLAGTFPTAYLYSIGSLVGASPELLGQVFDGRFAARALAGTIGRDGDPRRDADVARVLLHSAKDRHEHQLLQSFLAERLAAWVEDLSFPLEPELLTLTNVHHLMTVFAGRMGSAGSGPGGLVDLIAAIHPTPAIAGVPQADALDWIRAHEPPRGRLGGFAGWTDRDGNGQAVLVIRSLELDGRTARLVVGNGIVGDSNPADEVRENQAKARGILDAVTSL